MKTDKQDNLDTSDIESIARDFISRLIAGAGDLRLKSLLSKDMGDVIKWSMDTSPAFVVSRAQSRAAIEKCLDFGCGKGPHKKLIESKGITWTGCDFEGSVDPAALGRRGTELEGQVYLYNGIRLGFEDSSFDLVWSWQSLEHLTDPESNLKEIARCLKTNAVFAGSVSFLEPYHAQSTFGYSPYGFQELCKRNGLRLVELYPAVDGLSLVLRRICMILGYEEDISLRNQFLQNGGLFASAFIEYAKNNNLPMQHVATALAQVCGQYRFVCLAS